jgi:rare lipoprotein A
MGQRGDSTTLPLLTRAFSVAATGLLLAQCSGGNIPSRIDPRYGVSASPRVVAPGEPVPKGGGVYRVGKPYVVAGRVYVPEENRHYRAEGLASWYGDDFHGRLTANGEVFDMGSISAAHPTLPMPCYVRVTNLRNGRSIIARVNDRGPYAANRLIDVSQRTAQLLGFRDHGLSKVRVEYVGRAPLEGSDDRKLVATLRKGSPAPANVMLASAQPPLPSYSDPQRRTVADAPLPPERPFTLGDDDAKSLPRQVARAAPRPERREMTAQARINRTMGPPPGPTIASIIDSETQPRAMLPTASAYAPSGRGGAAFANGNGLY